MGLVLGFGLFMIIGTVLAILLMYKMDMVVTWIYKKKGISPLSSKEWYDMLKKG